MFINEATMEYILRHAGDDVRKLALQGSRSPGIDLQTALQQIAGRQTARHKLPTWAAADGIVYPPHLNMEQCSSELTARYKAQVLLSHPVIGKSVNGKSVIGKSVNGKSVNGKSVNGKSVGGKSVNGKSVNSKSEGGIFVDLTGGLGVDFYWLSQAFGQRYYVEQDEELCAIAKHNFSTLRHACEIIHGDAGSFLADMPHATVVYADPARRNRHGARTYGIEDCTPNMLQLLPQLAEKADFIVIKLSPMLDWRRAVEQLKCVAEVHIVSIDNECKELLVVIATATQREEERPCMVHCVNITGKDDRQEFTFAHHRSPNELPPPSRQPSPTPEHFLYEPNASIMKAGCFAQLEQACAARQLAPNSHLFLSADEIGDFPGRRFKIMAISSMNKKELKHTLSPLESANIAVRNFPLSAEQLRKRLKLKEGGIDYIFATTDGDGSHKLYICRKIS